MATKTPTFFLTNMTEASSLIFKQGALVIAPKQSLRVSKIDVDSGVFDDFISRGLAALSEAPVTFETQEVGPTEPIDPFAPGMTEAQLKNHLAKNGPPEARKPEGTVTGFGLSASTTN